MKVNVSVDSGKYETKAVSGDKEITFLTRIDEERVDFGGLNNARTHRVVFNGKSYRVGDSAYTESFADTKAENIHALCVYTAVAMLCNDGDNVSIVTGCPLSVYCNKEARTQYQRFIGVKGQTVTISVDGKRKTFTIDRVLVLPESSGVVYGDMGTYIGKTVSVIDIGGLNTNCCVYKNCTPEFPTVFTTRLGGKEMCKGLLDTLNTQLGLSVALSPYQMEDIMKAGYVPNRRDTSKEQLSRKIIHNFRLRHVQNIFNSCVEHNWNTDTMEIIFIGGASLMLKEEIKEVFGVTDDAFFEDAKMLNVRGFLKALG